MLNARHIWAVQNDSRLTIAHHIISKRRFQANPKKQPCQTKAIKQKMMIHNDRRRRPGRKQKENETQDEAKRNGMKWEKKPNIQQNYFLLCCAFGPFLRWKIPNDCFLKTKLPATFIWKQAQMNGAYLPLSCVVYKFQWLSHSSSSFLSCILYLSTIRI